MAALRKELGVLIALPLARKFEMKMTLQAHEAIKKSESDSLLVNVKWYHNFMIGVATCLGY